VAHDEASLRVRLRDALQVAMKDRDRVSVAALRSTLGAIDNAEAVRVEGPADYGDGGMGDAGLGMAEVERAVLSDDEVVTIVRSEIEERVAEADDFERCGERERAERLRGEAAVLARQLEG
jgi:uncharacterized protein YqeY